MYGLYILVNKSHRTALLWYVYIVKSVKFFRVEIAIPFPGFFGMQGNVCHLYKQYYKHFFEKYNFGRKIRGMLLTQLPTEKQ